ncbi:uncharacterized protein LOC143486104 isoform X4 [Brachyhypopomus gauderio]|uniref:uncharacterized protein LOC143486104 isoform X4 n=1 Tax=Brachyhypopomus gauderio TaxID=698409 RepID=UPI00404270FA
MANVSADGELRIMLHLSSDSDCTCTKSVGTDLTMLDIGNLEDLQTENKQLRKLIASLEAKLQLKEEKELHKEVHFDDFQDEDCGDHFTVQELKDEPDLLAILKTEPNPKEITPYGHTHGGQCDLQQAGNEPRLHPAGQTGLTTAAMQDTMCESDCQSMSQTLEDVSGLTGACKTEQDLLEIPYPVCKDEYQQIPLDPCAVKLEHTRRVQEPITKEKKLVNPVDTCCEEMTGLEEKEKVRRHAEINDREIEVLETFRNEEATVKQTMWAVRCFQTWCAEKNISVNFKKLTKSELNQILRQFYATVKNGKGESYGFSSYVGLRAGLNRYINEPPLCLSWYIMKDSEFATSNNVFVGVLKKLRREGQDKSIHYPAISDEDFVKIKNSEALSPNTPAGLVNKVWFDVQWHLGRRPKEGNRQLKPESFVICKDNNGLRFATLTLNEASKNRKEPNERVREIRQGLMYEQPGDLLCPVASLEKYLAVLPPNPPAFYLHPKRTNDTSDVWYSREPMGVNFLGSMLPRICKAAGIKTVYTNHCLQSTTMQKPSYAGLDTKEMMAVVGHRSGSSLQSYCHPNYNEQRRWSNILTRTVLSKRTCSEPRPSSPPAKKSENHQHCAKSCTINGNILINKNSNSKH